GVLAGGPARGHGLPRGSLAAAILASAHLVGLTASAIRGSGLADAPRSRPCPRAGLADLVRRARTRVATRASALVLIVVAALLGGCSAAHDDGVHLRMWAMG